MELRQEDFTIYLRLDKGEKILTSILKLCQQKNIQGAYFQGIGACDEITLATYIPEKQNFIQHQFSGMLEMTSLMGNISLNKHKEPHLHAHATFSYLQDGKIAVIGGHLQEARIGYTAEIILHLTAKPIQQKIDPLTGIDIWKL